MNRNWKSDLYKVGLERGSVKKNTIYKLKRVRSHFCLYLGYVRLNISYVYKFTKGKGNCNAVDDFGGGCVLYLWMRNSFWRNSLL